MPQVFCYDSYGNPISQLTQWDLNRSIIIKDYNSNITPIFYFCNRSSEHSLKVKGTLNNNEASAQIPNILLQKTNTIAIYVCLEDNEYESLETIFQINLPVCTRPRPNNYEYQDNLEIVELGLLKKELENSVSESKTLQLKLLETIDATNNLISDITRRLEIGEFNGKDAEPIIIDTELSEDSNNPIANSIVAKALKFGKLLGIKRTDSLEAFWEYVEKFESTAGTNDYGLIFLTDYLLNESGDIWFSPSVFIVANNGMYQFGQNIDFELDTTSPNPIQNSVLAKLLNDGRLAGVELVISVEDLIRIDEKYKDDDGRLTFSENLGYVILFVANDISVNGETSKKGVYLWCAESNRDRTGKIYSLYGDASQISIDTKLSEGSNNPISNSAVAKVLNGGKLVAIETVYDYESLMDFQMKYFDMENDCPILEDGEYVVALVLDDIYDESGEYGDDECLAKKAIYICTSEISFVIGDVSSDDIYEITKKLNSHNTSIENINEQINNFATKSELEPLSLFTSPKGYIRSDTYAIRGSGIYIVDCESTVIYTNKHPDMLTMSKGEMFIVTEDRTDGKYRRSFTALTRQGIKHIPDVAADDLNNCRYVTKDELNITSIEQITESVIELKHNSEQRQLEQVNTSLSLSLPEDIPNDYISGLVFNSGESPVTLSYPESIIFTGDDVTDNVFVPKASKTYDVMFWYNGVNINAVARGVPYA